MFRISLLVLMFIKSSFSRDCNYQKHLTDNEVYNITAPGLFWNNQCQWEIETNKGSKIILQCPRAILPSDPYCFNKLEISPEGDLFFTQPHVMCGILNFQTESQKNRMTIRLTTMVPIPRDLIQCSFTSREGNQTRCNCGRRNGPRIVGGEQTLKNEFPSMAGLVDWDQRSIYCGATIINERQVITSAHCVIYRQVNEIGVIVGEHDIRTGTDTNSTKLYLVESWKIHERYRDSYENDIAIVQIRGKIILNDMVGPVCLPFKFYGNQLINETVIATGWGLLEYGGPKSPTLQKVALNVISNEQCKEYHSKITGTIICTIARERDSCQYDSGGPLYYEYEGHLFLAGIISGGIGCASNEPAINIRVTSFLTWLTENSIVTLCSI